MINFSTPFTLPFTLGGHVFHTVEECCREFLVPCGYVTHMLESANYPGCKYLTGGELTNYLQTLSTNPR